MSDVERPDIEAIKVLADSATAGPWEWGWYQGQLLTMTVGGDMHRIVSIEDYVNSRQEDRALIAAARTAVPQMAAYIEALEAERENWRRFCKHVTVTRSWNMLDEDEFDEGGFEIDELLFLMGGTPVGDDAAGDAR
jgi:Zn-dependent oligopeptidase